MAKFVRKADKIEAFKWVKNTKQTELPIWIIEAIKNGDIWLGANSKEAVIFVRTIVGTYEANIGDYIIQRKEGELYPCNAQEFEELYERVEYTVTIENTTNYAENIEEGHRCADKDNNKKNKLELSAKLELDTKDFEENIKNVTKEIEIFNKAVGTLEQKINGIFGREKVNEVKINIPTISKSESVEEVNGKLLKELKSQKLIVSEKDKKFKKYDICFKNGECISGVIKEHVADKLTTYFPDSQSDIDCLRAIEDEEKLVIFNTADVQVITISDYIENEEIDYI
ncbi:TPA: hypothetical protein ACG3I2_002011 [Clostridioides difficile]|nr:hypothetical protein [Clostridioides difficile]